MGRDLHNSWSDFNVFPLHILINSKVLWLKTHERLEDFADFTILIFDLPLVFHFRRNIATIDWYVAW